LFELRTFERFVCLWFDLRVGAYLEESSGGIVEVGKGEGQKKKKGIWGGCGRYLMLFPDQRDGLADCEMDACNEAILFTFSYSDFSIRLKHVNE